MLVLIVVLILWANLISHHYLVIHESRGTRKTRDLNTAGKPAAKITLKLWRFVVRPHVRINTTFLPKFWSFLTRVGEFYLVM